MWVEVVGSCDFTMTGVMATLQKSFRLLIVVFLGIGMMVECFCKDL